MGHVGKPIPIPHLPMKVVPILYPHLVIPSPQTPRILLLPIIPRPSTGLTYACPMAYVVEDGTS